MFNVQNVEDILENKLLECLSYLYNKDNHTSIIHILYLRSLIYYNKKEVSCEELSNFLLLELNLSEHLIFNDQNISLTNRYADNCLLNVIDNLIFRHLEVHYNDIRKGIVCGKEIIGELFSKFTDYARKKTRTIKSINKKNIYKYFMLEALNDEFNMTINTFKRFDCFYYEDNHNDFVITFDEECKRYYDLYLKETENTLEKDLEDYIYKNGLLNIKILKRQYKTENGIIDMLGIDEDNNTVIIELKVVSKPRDLLWQINLYRNDLLNIYSKDKLRVVVVSPKLDDSIKKLLPNYCELIEFKKNKNKFTFRKVVEL